MKVIFFALWFFALNIGTACAEPISLHVEESPPTNMVALIASENQMLPVDIHALPDGSLSWKGGFIGAVVFEDTIKNCAIYTFERGLLNPVFADAPCEFKGPPKLMRDRGVLVPDVVYELSVFWPNRDAMVDHLVALYYDAEKDGFCESRSLADWYQSGNRNLSPNLQDGQCTVGSDLAVDK
ncbi:hypothetical protein ACIPIN_14645 [Pseudomonas sp. NPDC087697]|uniref:hypothetical protein n=1 Tax=Pseudomonas sp. NPDC087697 TaxID=3364447 RepID=UPI0037FCFF87